MGVDKRYPKDWKKRRIRILDRAGRRCEQAGCTHKDGEVLWSVKYKGKVTGWFKTREEALAQPRTMESKYSKKLKRSIPVDNPKRIVVSLQIAHLDHDEENHDVSDDRLRAMCQLCHLRYDAAEKYRREIMKVADAGKRNRLMQKWEEKHGTGCLHCEAPTGFYLGTSCPHCNRSFRVVND